MRIVHALLLAAVLLTATLGPTLAARTQPFSVWDDGPLGLGHLAARDARGVTFAGLPAMVAEGRLQPRPGWAVVVAEPVRGFTPDEVAALRVHLEQGGTALLLGASPSLEELLGRLRAGVTLGGAVYSPGFRHNAAFPVAAGLGGDWVLTQPRVVRGGTPLLTNSLAWEDLNANGAPDLGEPVGSAALAAVASVGLGQLIVVGTASPLTRDGWSAGPGARLLAMATGGAAGVVVDEAHRAPLDPLGVGGVLTGSSWAWLLPAVALALGTLVALRPRLHRKEEAPAPPGRAREVVAEAEAQR